MSLARKIGSLFGAGAAQIDPSLTFPTGTGPIPWRLVSLPTGWIWDGGAILLPETPHAALRQAYLNDGSPYGQDGSGHPPGCQTCAPGPANRPALC